HQVDQLGRGELRGEAQVALVLAVGVVDQDDRSSGLQLLEDLGNRRKGHWRAVRRRSVALRRTGPRHNDPARAAHAPGRAGQQTDTPPRVLRDWSAARRGTGADAPIPWGPNSLLFGHLLFPSGSGREAPNRFCRATMTAATGEATRMKRTLVEVSCGL